MGVQIICERSLSFVLEMENAATVSWKEVGMTLRILAEQLGQIRGIPGAPKPQVIVAHPGGDDESRELRDKIAQHVPQLIKAARLSCVGVPRGRYYELKNAGALQADGELIVLLDSDMLPEPGWLTALLAPFADPRVLVTSGHTYLGHSSLLSRTLALVWVFPLRDHDARDANRRGLNANNCGFRTEWLRANLFPIDNGFKVGCTKQMRRLTECGVPLTRVAAYAQHAPLTGWRFFVWRALVTGRDADRKYEDIKTASRSRRLLNAGKFWIKMQIRSLRRLFSLHRHVSMPVWELPLAVGLGCTFYTLALLGQLARVAGIVGDRPEFVPTFAQHH